MENHDKERQGMTCQGKGGHGISRKNMERQGQGKAWHAKEMEGDAGSSSSSTH
jgi:hypothetical protein